MNGAVAAGSTITAEAGAEMLRAGGNAVDAAVAACFATAAGEPVLTSLAGGGALLVRHGSSGAVTLCDFFADAPGLEGRTPEQLDFFAAELDFGSATQHFHIGAGAAAVPGVIPGLCSALERWGRLPLAEVIRPACSLLRDGVPLEPWQAHTFQVLGPILFHTLQGRRQFGRNGVLLGVGDRYRVPQLAELLEALAAGAWRENYDRLIGRPVVSQFGPEAGGLLGQADWEAYRVAFRQPLKIDYRGTVLHTNPPPAAGGALIALMLKLLEGEDGAWLCDSDRNRVHALCRVMRLADESRHDGAETLDLEIWQERFRSLGGKPLDAGPAARSGPGNTTHVSVVDSDGNAAAITFSYGEGNGHLIGDTGIMMNNLMGEEDLFPAGFHRWPPGLRLSTMMSPSILERPDGRVVVLGSGGANRIRTAITQVICRLVDCGDQPAQAVLAPRIHFEAGVLNAETSGWQDSGAFLSVLDAPRFVAFPELNLFFGGVHVVEKRPDGTVGGVGDPRRGGACVVVGSAGKG